MTTNVTEGRSMPGLQALLLWSMTPASTRGQTRDRPHRVQTTRRGYISRVHDEGGHMPNDGAWRRALSPPHAHLQLLASPRRCGARATGISHLRQPPSVSTGSSGPQQPSLIGENQAATMKITCPLPLTAGAEQMT